MSVLTKIDMGEVTRLTREGRLKEAMALLRGRVAPQAQDEAGSVAPQAGKWWGAFGEAGLRPAPRTFEEAAPSVAPGARWESRSFSGTAGRRTYKLYVPSRYDGTPLPLVVMLHGCTQTPDDFAVGTRINKIDEDRTYLVAYPEQTRAAKAQPCWNWFQPGDQQRGTGEPSLIAGIVEEIATAFTVDRSRIYAAGLSAGGAQAAIMAATYPDLFAAVGIHSGLACGAARDVGSAFAAMKGGGPAQPSRWPTPVPAIVFHGDADDTVHPANGERVVNQALPENAVQSDIEQGRAPSGAAFTRTVHRDGVGEPVLEQWLLHGAGHAWAGGDPGGSFTDPNGPDASREMARFFLEHAKGRGR